MMEMEDVLEQLKGKLVKIVYQNGNEVRVLRGRAKAFDSEMLLLQTLNNQFYIKRSCILKVQPVGNGDSNGNKLFR